MDLRKLLDGAELILDDGDLFVLEQLGEEVSEQDRAEAERRKKELQDQVTQAAGTCFGPL